MDKGSFTGRKIAYELSAIGLAVVGLYYIVLGFNAESEGVLSRYVVVGTIALCVAGVLWQRGNQTLFNHLNDTIKIITGTDGIGMEILYDAFKDLDTSLGKPWLAEIEMIKGTTMIFGPNSEGQYIFVVSNSDDQIQIGFNSVPKFIQASEDDQWRLTPEKSSLDSTADIVRYKFSATYLLPELAAKISRFRDTQVADLTPIEHGMNTDVYMFYEEFRWAGQDFFMYDSHGNKKMKITSSIPCKTFKISHMPSEIVLFKLTKKLFHIMPHYDLYEQNEKIGQIRKKLGFRQDYFVADTSYGKLELKKMNAMLGSNYQVTIDQKPIGTIAEKLNLEITNLVFDNFVLTVSDPKYLSLMTAMAVMAARELRRDQVSNIRTLHEVFDD